MEVRFLTAGGAEQHPVEDLPKLLDRTDGFAWVDVPVFDEAAERMLVEVLGCRPTALRLCQERNHIPQVHVYPEHVLFILHTPEPGEAGHVHLLELDQFVGHRYLITVHGPINPQVPLESAMVETAAVWDRIRQGKFRPASPFELSYSIGTAIARRQQTFVADMARTVADLERRVTGGNFRHPERLLELRFLLVRSGTPWRLD